MATLQNGGLSGKINGDTIKLPVQCRKFNKAIKIAQALLTNPAIKAEYKAALKGNQTEYNLAVKDALRAPTVTNIKVERNKEGVRNLIIVSAEDDFKVKSVTVSIFNKAGLLIEKGEAFQFDDDSKWYYSTINHNKIIFCSKIIATATDLPGNTASLEMILE